MIFIDFFDRFLALSVPAGPDLVPLKSFGPGAGRGPQKPEVSRSLETCISELRERIWIISSALEPHNAHY